MPFPIGISQDPEQPLALSQSALINTQECWSDCRGQECKQGDDCEATAVAQEKAQERYAQDEKREADASEHTLEVESTRLFLYRLAIKKEREKKNQVCHLNLGLKQMVNGSAID